MCPGLESRPPGDSGRVEPQPTFSWSRPAGRGGGAAGTEKGERETGRYQGLKLQVSLALPCNRATLAHLLPSMPWAVVGGPTGVLWRAGSAGPKRGLQSLWPSRPSVHMLLPLKEWEAAWVRAGPVGANFGSPGPVDTRVGGRKRLQCGVRLAVPT